MEHRVDKEVLESDILVLAAEDIEEISKEEYEDDTSDNVDKYPDYP
jgi:hypothetical protein